MNLSIVLPISQSLSKEREDNFNIIKHRYGTLFDSEVIIGIDDSQNTQFCKSRAVNNGVKQSTKDNVLIADIDIFINKEQIIAALNKIDNHGWVIPYDTLIKLNKEQTIDFINDINNQPQHKTEYETVPPIGGGLQLIKKEIFNLVRGYDERFIGWGGEDTSFLFSIQCLYKIGINMPNSLAYHLYHPRQPGIELYHGNKTNNKTLRDQYAKAARKQNIIAMKKLIEMRKNYENN